MDEISKRLNEKDDNELLANLSKVFNEWKKYFGDLIVVIGQLNGDIEQPIRKENPLFHYPKKTDIHGSNQMFWACDTVIIFHRPEILYIEKYGREKRDTKQLIHIAFIKTRHGKLGHVWLKNELHKGLITDWTTQ